MTVEDFRSLVVEPNLAEYDRDYDQVHRAFNAVAALDAYAAHIFSEASSRGVNIVAAAGIAISPKADDSEFRNALSGLSAEFRILRDLAKANKHAKLTRHKSTVSASSQTTRKTAGWGAFKWGEGRYGGLPQVFVVLDSGEEHYVETLVSKSMLFLDDLAVKLGLLKP
jgi:hypothetical protein